MQCAGEAKRNTAKIKAREAFIFSLLLALAFIFAVLKERDITRQLEDMNLSFRGENSMLFMNFQNFVLNARLTVACKWL